MKTWLQVKVRLRVRLLNRSRDGVRRVGDSLLFSQNSSSASSLVPSQLSICQGFSEHSILSGLGVGQSQILSILSSWNLLKSSPLSSPSHPHLLNARTFLVFRPSLLLPSPFFETTDRLFFLLGDSVS